MFMICTFFYPFCPSKNVKKRTTEILVLYSTEKKARDAIQNHKDLEGFRDLPLECFEIHEYEIDRSSWNDGFTTVRYGK